LIHSKPCKIANKGQTGEPKTKKKSGGGELPPEKKIDSNCKNGSR